MRLLFHPVWQRIARLTRKLAVLLVLAGQVCGGALPAQAGAQAGAFADARGARLAALDAAMVFCQAGHGKGKSEAPPHHCLTSIGIVRTGGCAVQHGAGPEAGPFLPPRSAAWVGAYHVPQARAPPSLHAASSYPRGPPSLI